MNIHTEQRRASPRASRAQSPADPPLRARFGSHPRGDPGERIHLRVDAPASDEAKSAVEQAVLTLAQQALAGTQLIGSDVLVSLRSAVTPARSAA